MSTERVWKIMVWKIMVWKIVVWKIMVWKIMRDSCTVIPLHGRSLFVGGEDVPLQINGLVLMVLSSWFCTVNPDMFSQLN
jgi:hypothetical protein